ncbi:MAG: DNA-binding protein [Candidatus Abyssobacteria bacterium SURF_17]|jgi:excisionase family DNA binding protein|uniref:DNA-binding protein n=1 Tax=Candidatus Abyssobacteria bacterium SURF_17 TaxID=2093361 RepID=A0A419F8N8_9BACT|nr:MAG: DNA-binding protein [Candidatus Abyssubacteria bacterium SURF_17]
MNDMNVAAEWLTTKEAAQYLGVSEPTIFRWMREGTLSFFKIGGSTRFRRENLDLAARKVTGKQEAEQRAGRCPVCGHGFLLSGQVRSTGKIYFVPGKAKFFVLSDSNVEVSARACPACGHVDMFADTAKLTRLMRQEDSEASNRADEERDDDPGQI